MANKNLFDERRRRNKGTVSGIISQGIEVKETEENVNDTAESGKTAPNIAQDSFGIEDSGNSNKSHLNGKGTGFVLLPTEPEGRSKSVTFRVPPSIYKSVQKQCSDENMAVNELVNQFFSFIAENGISSLK